MTMMVHFPLDRLGHLQQVLDQLGTLPRRVSVAVAPDITRELQKEYAQGRDPHNRKWKKLATGRPSHLTETRKLRNQTRAAAMPGNRIGVRIMFGSRARIAAFHQAGTVRMVARRILPDRGMPPTWLSAIKRAYRTAYQEATR